MKYIDFKKQMAGFTAFSLNDIKAVNNNFQRRRLYEWQKKGYIKKVIKEYYVFSDLVLNEHILFEVANKIYSPSYISLSMALAFYNLIPESVYEITSISTRKTNKFKTSLAEFSYRTLKPKMFFGFRIIKYDTGYFKIAEPEKAILDYFYLRADLSNKIDFESLRFNKEVFLKSIDIVKLKRYLNLLNHKALTKRLTALMECMKND